MKQNLLAFLLLLTFLAAQAQTKPSPDPATFLTDTKAQLLTGKVKDADKLGVQLEEVWSGGRLTARQQQQVMVISQRMQRKRLPVAPYFEHFYHVLTAAVTKHNLKGAALDNLLEVISEVVQQEEAPYVERFLSTSSLFLTSGKLFQSKNYNLYASNGNFSFSYEGNSSKKGDADAGEPKSEWDNFSWDDETGTAEDIIDDGWGTSAKTAKKVDPKVAEQKRRDAIKQRFIQEQPKLSGPILKLENVTLTFVTARDSTSIRNTSGQLMPLRFLFVGEGGAYEWDAIGSSASAVLKKYSFDIKTPAFKVSDVTLTYPSTLEAPVEGGFEFRSTKRNSHGQKEYPRFASFTNDAKVKNLGNNISYRGGFTLVGDRIGSRPLDGSLSEVVVSHNRERKFRSLSYNFALSDSVFSATRASVVLYQKKDSIMHPAMQLRFSKSENELTLSKDKGSYKKTAFFDTFHKMEITAERLKWRLDSPEVHFMNVSANTHVPVQLESTNYYSNNRYQQLIGVATFHPLQVIVSHASKVKKNEFYAGEVASTSRIKEAAIKEAAKSLSYDGFLSYHPETGYITLKPKALHYVGASHKTIDYDHLIISSIAPSGKNATLNLDNNQLLVRGVDRITFNNDSIRVYAKPDSGLVRVLSKRDIEFNGQVFAGRLAFRGTNFKFNYDDFMIDMQKLDSVALVADSRKEIKNLAMEQVLTSRAGKMAGKLYINKPNNKSGKEAFRDYPKFDAPLGAQVAFNKPSVLGGAYDSTVYFDIPPFKMDSLSTGKNAIAFDGQFNSGGIFPPIKTKLTMMPDKTLGFNYQSPANGLPAYGGKGMVFDTIMMNSSGIQSKGRIKYLAATLEAPDFTYYQDGVKSKAGTGATIAEGGGASYPQVSIAAFELNWLPKQDTMYILAMKEPMQVYKEAYKFKGTAKLSPGGLYGSGELTNPTASIVSPKFQFKDRSFSGNHAQMLVKSDVEGKAAIKAQDVAISYDLSKNMVDFSSEQKGVASIEFPKAQYKTSMTRAVWDINKQQVSLQADEKNGNNYFYSMHPQQSGLRFKVATGEYNLKENTIQAGGVPFISVADAYIVPDSGKVVVAGDATIKTLRNARIMADSLQQFHKMYAGNINVLSREAFKGDAVQDYYSAGTDSFKLKFSDFNYGLPEYQDEKDKKKLQKEKHRFYTYASASITDEKPFYIFPRILYHGKVALHANKQHLDFDGALKLNFAGGEGASDWFPYKVSALNPDDTRIPIVDPKTANGQPLHTGLHISSDYAKIYNTFVSRKQDPDDLDLFVVDGLLSYDKTLKEFKIGRQERAYGEAYEGNVLTYNEFSNTILFEGKLNLMKPLKNFKLETAGNGSAQVDSSRYNLDAFIAFDLTAPTQAIAEMAKGIAGNAGGAGEALGRSEALYYKLGEFVGDREARKYKSQAATAHVPLPSISGKLVRSLVFSKVDLRWSTKTNAWYSVGKLSLASMLKEDINAQLDGFMEVRQDQNGEPVVHLYIQADPYTWYYLSYLDNGLTLVSSSENFNKVVRSKAKGGRKASSYGVYAGEAIEKNQFIEQFQKDYLSGKAGFNPASDLPAYNTGSMPDSAEKEDPTKQHEKKKKKLEPFSRNTSEGQNNQ